MKTYIIPLFIPHLGCKNECVFCNQRAISGKEKQVEKQQIVSIIDRHLAYYDKKKRKRIEVAFYGGSFTGIDEELQNEYLETIQDYIKTEKIDSIRISTRPDYINRKTLLRLREYGVETIELGIQSLDDEVLKLTKRGHTRNNAMNASSMIRRYGFNLGHQVMIGLPGSTFVKERRTVIESIMQEPKFVRIYPTIVIAKTELENMYKSGKYTPLSLEEAVERTKVLYKMYEEAGVKVIRTGLHVTEELQDASAYVAGPLHSAFGQLVKSSIIYDKTYEEITMLKNLFADLYRVKITANEATINDIVGVNRRNVKKYEEEFGIKLEFTVKKEMEYGQMEVDSVYY